MPLTIIPREARTMLINESETWYYLDREGQVVEGGPEAPAGAATLLLAPGGQLPDALAKQHGLVGSLKSSADVKMKNPVTGEPITLVDGRAYADRLLEPAARKNVVPTPAPTPAPTPVVKHVPGPGEPGAAVQTKNVAPPAK